MKKLIMLLLLLGGTVLTTYAQGRHNGWGKGHKKHYDRDRYCDDDRYEGRRYEKRYRDRDWDDCRRPRRVVYVQPYPVYRPRPVREVYYAPARPGVVFNAGVTIVR